MATTVYLQNPVGVAQSYEVEKGVKLSDGASGWVAFGADTGNISRKTGDAWVSWADTISTMEEANAALRRAGAIITIPAGCVVISTYAIGMLSANMGDLSIPNVVNPTYWGATVTQIQNQDGTTTVEAQWENRGSLAPNALVVRDSGYEVTQVYLEVVYR